MSERAVDPARSRIVLVGPAYYEDPKLTDVPEVAHNISDLAQVLTSERLGGFSPFHCVPVPSAAGVAQVGDVLVRAADEAEDLLLFYYSGHGLLGPRRRELYLSLAATQPDQLAFTALPFEAVRDACLDSRATSRVVILDSCFSGRAIGETLAGFDETVIGELEVSGAYTLTSSPANRTALVLPGEVHTAFTERLLTMLSAGSPTAGTMINLGDIYRHLHSRLRAEGLPLPQRCGVNNADLLGLVRNVQYEHAPVEAPVAADTAEPERVAGADMTERLLQAERIAHTIGDGLWRTRALVRVASAAAGTFEPAHVERLTDEAEQAATTVSRTTEQALTAVVSAMATLAPDRAERIANRAARVVENGYALTALSETVAASDPDRAERIAKTINSKYHRWRALGAVAASVAAGDPARAGRIADAITDKDTQARVLAVVAKAVAASDPHRAERIANSITDRHRRLRALGAVAVVVAADDPVFAEDIAKSIACENLGWSELSAVAVAVAAGDSDRAERIANSITAKHMRLRALSAVAEVVAADDPDAAEDLAKSIAYENLRWSALSAVAVAVAADDPQRAERIANEMIHNRNKWAAWFFAGTTLSEGIGAVAAAVAADDPDRAVHIAHATPSRDREGVLAAVAVVVAAEDPDRAERIAGVISGRSAKEGVLAAVALSVAAEDSDRAERIAGVISGRSAKEGVLAAVALSVAAEDPDRAERIAGTLADEDSRVRVVTSIAGAVALADPDRARQVARWAPGSAEDEILYSVVLAVAARPTSPREGRTTV
ncbi:caspase domain-containing protein [Streptomyces sp. NPDC050421]|uniref:caspase family protein n=1 Tax=unclassified Streptomyces TaxID=2593676 RepID=UPI00378B5485